MMRVGQIKEEEIEQVQEDIKALDSKIAERLSDPLGAQAVILSLLYDAAYKEELFAVVQEENPYLCQFYARKTYSIGKTECLDRLLEYECAQKPLDGAVSAF
jgi:hypothetical protein